MPISMLVRCIFSDIPLSKTSKKLQQPWIYKLVQRLSAMASCGYCSSSSKGMAGRISWYCALLLAVMLVLSCCESSRSSSEYSVHPMLRENVMKKACDEIYVVREGETLQTISEKCEDPFIVEENPHIHDPDDVFPGLVIKITPFSQR